VNLSSVFPVQAPIITGITVHFRFHFRCISIHHCHHQHVHERLGVFPVPWSSKYSWSLHLFFGLPMSLRPFGLYCSACFGILFVSTSVRVVATFTSTVLFPSLCAVLQFFPQYIDSFLYPVLLVLISTHKLLYFNFFSASFCTTFLSAGIATSISEHVVSFLF
jgi:hypothetical protein